MIPYKITIGNHRPTTKGDSPLLWYRIFARGSEQCSITRSVSNISRKKNLDSYLNLNPSSPLDSPNSSSRIRILRKPKSLFDLKNWFEKGVKRSKSYVEQQDSRKNGKKWRERMESDPGKYRMRPFLETRLRERERDRDRQRKREREIGREAEGAANRCTACAPFLLDFSKPIERSRLREQHA